MTARRAISGDSHTMEPGELWAERLDKPFRDDAPRVVDNENGVGSAFAIPGLGRQQISGAWALGWGGPTSASPASGWSATASLSSFSSSTWMAW